MIGHPLRSRSIYQNAANCKTICFRYTAPGGGGGGGYGGKLAVHAHIMMSEPLSVGQAACRNGGRLSL